jgi:putative transposase
MDQLESLSHSVRECKYHVAFIPECRRRVLYEELRPHLGEVFRRLAEQKESRILEGHLMPDHVHILLSIPPKYAVSEVVGYIKGKSAIHLARSTANTSRILPASISGREVILCRLWDVTKQRFGSTSAIKKLRISAWTH